MIRTDLCDRAKRICHHLSQAVTELVPEGIGRWPGAWDMVAEAGADFMLALATWEADPSHESAASVKAAHDDVLEAWRRASAEFDTLANVEPKPKRNDL